MTLIFDPLAPALTPLDDTLTRCAERFTTTGHLTGPEEIQAVSACHRWLYERLEQPGTPWVVMYQPTGQAVSFGRLAAARRWTAHESAALAHLRSLADDVVARGGHTDTINLRFVRGRQVRVAEDPSIVAERLAHAHRHLAVLDGRLIVGDPDGTCSCGGYLIGELHADACAECIGDPVDRRRYCRQLEDHQACPAPDAVLCQHAQCGGRAGIDLCNRGADWCCGTCCS